MRKIKNQTLSDRFQGALAIAMCVVLVLPVVLVTLYFYRCGDQTTTPNFTPTPVPIPNPTPIPAPTTTALTFDQTIGMCGFIDDSMDVLSACGVVREYHNYRWVTEKADHTCRFSIPNNWWYWDTYYQNLCERGIEPVPCIQGTSQADRRNYNSNKQQKPINSDEDSRVAASYSEHASTMFQYAARYGKVVVDDSKLLLYEGQERLSGLGYIQYYENWNEPDKTWEGTECHFDGDEYAAMCSADYDGDEGRLGDTYGIKQADPNAKLVMGGIAGGRWTVEYLEAMQTWAKANRQDQRIPIDVINFHMYSAKDHPEKYEYVANFEKIVAWRDANAPELEIWLTEFGWDTNASSPHAATKDQQRDWLMRTYLLAHAHGIDRSTMYMSRDSGDANSMGKYATSGLVAKDKKTKKPAWYGVATLKNVMTGYVFDAIEQEADDIYVYRFRHQSDGTVCYVLWSPTANGSKIEQYTLTIGATEQATLTTLVNQSTTGTTTELTVTDGKVVVPVSETPIFVKKSVDNR